MSIMEKVTDTLAVRMHTIMEKHILDLLHQIVDFNELEALERPLLYSELKGQIGERGYKLHKVDHADIPMSQDIVLAHNEVPIRGFRVNTTIVGTTAYTYSIILTEEQLEELAKAEGMEW